MKNHVLQIVIVIKCENFTRQINYFLSAGSENKHARIIEIVQFVENLDYT